MFCSVSVYTNVSNGGNLNLKCATESLFSCEHFLLHTCNVVDSKNCAITFITDVIILEKGIKLYYINQTSVLKINKNSI
jgi:hypothetical protein